MSRYYCTCRRAVRRFEPSSAVWEALMAPLSRPSTFKFDFSLLQSRKNRSLKSRKDQLEPDKFGVTKGQSLLGFSVGLETKYWTRRRWLNFDQRLRKSWFADWLMFWHSLKQVTVHLNDLEIKQVWVGLHSSSPGFESWLCQEFFLYFSARGQKWDQTHQVLSDGFHKCC